MENIFRKSKCHILKVFIGPLIYGIIVLTIHKLTSMCYCLYSSCVFYFVSYLSYNILALHRRDHGYLVYGLLPKFWPRFQSQDHSYI